MTTINESTKEELWARWEQLKASKPPDPKRKPTDQELVALRTHKKLVQDFLAGIPFNLDSWFQTKRQAVAAKSSTQNKSAKKLKLPKILIQTKPVPISLGWRPEELFRFQHVIPFMSHTRRSRYEEDQDRNMGIDRRVFSNLFFDNEPLRINAVSQDDNAATLLGHGVAYSEALCAESYYMAAKSRYPWDAKFIMEELTNSFDVASYGHNHLRLTATQRNRLVELGAPPDDFLLVEPSQEGDECKEEEPRWLRGQNGAMPVREGWHEIRHNVFFYILRQKFGPTAPTGSVARSTMEALLEIMVKSTRSELPLIVEHRQLDTFWGDGLTGEGNNVLGRILTQILLERAGLSKQVPTKPWSEVEEHVGKPNAELANYNYPREPS